ncbi:hypothetical protein B0H19DRAFT_1144200 [Mycena capillaripes]|nr:hypothetical protein B0H19DRAFT_1144200 [Mycena capillaripes]
MSLLHHRRPIGPTVNKLRNFRERKKEGGLVGNWRRDTQFLRISGFDATRLRASDFIDIPRSVAVYLDVHGYYPTHGRQAPFYELSFRAADSAYTRRDTRLRGFLHYHVPIPARPLSGGLRFRCAPSLAAFAQGADLLCPSGLPWTIPFADLVRIKALPVTQSLLRDNLVSFPDLIACHSTFHNKWHPNLPVVHAVGQPWLLDLSVPSVVLIPGPNSLLRCEVYPAVALYGSALVCFEYTGNPRAPHEVAIRVLELRSNIGLHPHFAHLRQIKAGVLLPHPEQSTFPRAEPLPWMWNYDSHPARMAAALYLLVHGPVPLPASAADFPLSVDMEMLTGPAPRADTGMAADAEGNMNLDVDPDAEVVFPSHRQNKVLRRWFYGMLPTKEEVARYAGRRR